MKVQYSKVDLNAAAKYLMKNNNPHKFTTHVEMYDYIYKYMMNGAKRNIQWIHFPERWCIYTSSMGLTCIYGISYNNDTIEVDITVSPSFHNFTMITETVEMDSISEPVTQTSTINMFSKNGV